MVLIKYKTSIASVIVVMFLTSSIAPIISSNEVLLNNNVQTTNMSLNIDYLSTNSAYPGNSVTIYGVGFGSIEGYVVLSGLRAQADSWTDTEIEFTVPDSGTTGKIYVRDSNDVKSNSVSFTVDRTLPLGQFESSGFHNEDIGLLGAAFLVETDGSYFYSISGFETLCTYEILGDGTHDLHSRIYLSQRVGDLKIYNDYLFLTGDHGLIVYRCSDLQNDTPEIVISIAGASYMSLDIKYKTGTPIDGTLIALCEYIPVWNTNILRIPLYEFKSEELEYLGGYTRSVQGSERYHSIVIDTLNPKLYVSGLKSLLGSDKYILELDISDLGNIDLNYRLETGAVFAFDMESIGDILWAGVVATGTIRFQVYDLKPGSSHLSLAQTVTGQYRLGRATRVKIIDESFTVGSAWSGERPDVYLLDTFNSGTVPLATDNSLDWAFDVTGYSTGVNEGKIIVADEWGGFITYDYTDTPNPAISHEQDYGFVIAAAMTQEIYLTDDRIFVADRGGGVWSADRYDLSDESKWKRVDWEWTESEPQPHPISALCTREDSIHGTLIAALGHNKAMAWGEDVYGILYKETGDDIEFMAISDKIDPPGLYSTGISVIWPEPDLAYMIIGSDGFRAYVINPDEPRIEIHADCENEGFGLDSFATNNLANCMIYYEDKIIIGSKPGLLVNKPTFNLYQVSYPEGVPDRNNPDRKINITKESSLNCLRYKTINHIDITDSGLIIVSTNQGVGLFHISWIPQLNLIVDSKAWSQIKIPDETYIPWWDGSWGSFQADARFADDNSVYVVKNPNGLWKIDFEINNAAKTHKSRPAGFYPGVQCGINYSQLLHGWQNPDIETLHHPYGLVVDGNEIYVHGWSGKVNRLTFQDSNDPPTTPAISGPTTGNKGTEYNYTFSSTDSDGDDLYYYIDWEDGHKEWIGPYGSGETIKVSHTWAKTGTYKISSKAKDENNGVSYMEELSVTMPRGKIFKNRLLYYIFEKLIDIFPILKLILKY